MAHRGFNAFAFMLLGSLACVSLPAYAGIGEVGSPVVPSNGPGGVGNAGGGDQTSDNTSGDEGDQIDKVQRKSLLVIKFTSNTTYFKPQLKNAIITTEKMRRGAFYDVISYVPSGPRTSGSSRTRDDNTDNNLNAVVRGIQELGVPGSRITTNTIPSDRVSNQEVHIFLKAPPGADKSGKQGKKSMKNVDEKPLPTTPLRHK